MLEKFFKKHIKVNSAVINADTLEGVPSIIPHKSEALESKSNAAYRNFLGIYLVHFLNKPRCEELVNQAYAAIAADFRELLTQQHQKPEVIELQASYIAENMRARAKRYVQELQEQALSVLADQRNYLLGAHVERLIATRQSGARENFVAVEPVRAFAHKLMADSTLQRGTAKDLDAQTIEALEQNLRERAYRDMLPILTCLSTLPPVMSETLKLQCKALELDLQILKTPELFQKRLPSAAASKHTQSKENRE